MARIVDATCPFCDAPINDIDFFGLEAFCLGCETTFAFRERKGSRLFPRPEARELWLHRNKKVQYGSDDILHR